MLLKCLIVYLQKNSFHYEFAIWASIILTVYEFLKTNYGFTIMGDARLANLS